MNDLCQHCMSRLWLIYAHYTKTKKNKDVFSFSNAVSNMCSALLRMHFFVFHIKSSSLIKTIAVETGLSWQWLELCFYGPVKQTFYNSSSVEKDCKVATLFTCNQMFCLHSVFFSLAHQSTPGDVLSIHLPPHWTSPLACKVSMAAPVSALLANSRNRNSKKT